MEEAITTIKKNIITKMMTMTMRMGTTTIAHMAKAWREGGGYCH